MGEPLRIFSRPRPVTVGITQKTIEHRHLLKADSKLNRRIVGALATAQQRYGGQIHAFTVLSTHLHLLATFRDSEQMANFMRFFTHKVSVEAKRIYSWGTRVFPERYVHVELTQEEAVELQRLRYVLSNGCKEGLVLSPVDWPGVGSAAALIHGEPLRGVWFDRTGLCKARGRKAGRHAKEEDFETEVELSLKPLPSQAHLSDADYRLLVAEMVRDIEAETLQMHKLSGTVPLGANRIQSGNPHRRQGDVPRRPRPCCHASSREKRIAVKKARSQIVAEYRRAAELLKAGHRNVRFPAGTFPPGLPFVPQVLMDGTPNIVPRVDDG